LKTSFTQRESVTYESCQENLAYEFILKLDARFETSGLALYSRLSLHLKGIHNHELRKPVEPKCTFLPTWLSFFLF